MFFRAALQWLVYTNIWIAFGAALWTGLTYKQLHISFDWNYVVFVFFSTLFIYNFQRLIKLPKYLAKHPTARLEWVHVNKTGVLFLVGLSLLVIAITALQFSLNTFLGLLGMGVLAVLYAYGFIGKSKKGLRDLPYLKLLLIALVWVVTCFVIPSGGVFEGVFWPLLVAKICFMIGITIPFDVRDIEVDEADKKTLPQLIGAESALRIGACLLLITAAINYLTLEMNTGVFALIAIDVFASVMVLKANKKSDLYYSAWLDGLLIAEGICLFIL